MAVVSGEPEVWLTFAGWTFGGPSANRAVVGRRVPLWELACSCGWQGRAEGDAAAQALAERHAASCFRYRAPAPC